MKYLLDTHVILWYFEDSKKLPSNLSDIIDNPEIEIFISSVSLWEIAIKSGMDKLDAKIALDELLDAIKIRDFNIIHIENDYLLHLSNLPFIHKDPFDRLVISSALAEGLTIITIDENIQKYDVSWLW